MFVNKWISIYNYKITFGKRLTNDYATTKQPFFCKFKAGISIFLKLFSNFVPLYCFSVYHSSIISNSITEISLIQDASIGKNPTTLVLFLIFLFILSRLFVVQIDL